MGQYQALWIGRNSVVAVCHIRLESQLIVLSLLGMKLHAVVGTCTDVLPLAEKVVVG